MNDNNNYSGGSQRTKYGDLIKDHEWQEPEEPEPDPRPRVEVNWHSVVIDWFVDEKYIDRYRFRFGVSGRVVRGWTVSDIEHNGTEDYTNDGTWGTLPAPVKKALAKELGIDSWEGYLDLPDHLRDGSDEMAALWNTGSERSEDDQ